MIKKIFKKIPPTAFPLLGCVLLMCVLIFIINYRINAESIGDKIGNTTGTIVGKFIGSLNGITEGHADGYEAGKEDAISAEDTTAELTTKIKEVSRLQVLVASGTYNDIIKIGDKDDPDYAAIISQKYNAVFMVDLATAKIELKEDGLYIQLDQPSAEFIPIGEITMLDEYQKRSYTGSSKDGHTAAMNSINKIKEEGMRKFDDYGSMIIASRTSAEKQLVGLVNAVSLTKPEVIIEWR